jgi:hypothetical protein
MGLGLIEDMPYLYPSEWSLVNFFYAGTSPEAPTPDSGILDPAETAAIPTSLWKAISLPT